MSLSVEVWRFSDSERGRGEGMLWGKESLYRLAVVALGVPLLALGPVRAVRAANCMDADPVYWQDGRRLPQYDTLMSLMACQANATPTEGTQLNDTSACNWFLSRALEKLYGVKDFVPAGDAEWLSANAIYDHVRGDPNWSRLGSASDPAVLADAAQGAANGQPVIAASKGNPHGHVALILPGELLPSGSWNQKVPNSASFFLDETRTVAKAYVGCKLSWAFTSPNGVEIFWRLKAQ